MSMFCIACGVWSSEVRQVSSRLCFKLCCVVSFPLLSLKMLYSFSLTEGLRVLFNRGFAIMAELLSIMLN